jgi:hypothetical protein
MNGCESKVQKQITSGSEIKSIFSNFLQKRMRQVIYLLIVRTKVVQEQSKADQGSSDVGSVRRNSALGLKIWNEKRRGNVKQQKITTSKKAPKDTCNETLMRHQKAKMTGKT